MPVALVVVVVLVAAAGLTAGLAIVLIPYRAHASAHPADGFRSSRVEGVLHNGTEQTLIALTRDLDVPVGGRDVGYGQLYLEQHDDTRLVIQTRSQLNRGFVGVIDLTRTGSTTRVQYALLRLPADDTVRARVRGFETALIAALQHQGAGDSLRITPTAIRELRDTEAPRPAHDLLPPPPTEEGAPHPRQSSTKQEG